MLLYVYSPYGYYFDPTYLLVLIGLVLSLWAQYMVNSRFKKYSKVRSSRNITGAEVAERILRSHGIYDVSIEHIAGKLSDHYDPRNKVLRLSDSTYNSTSVAAIGVAAHECGHAVQHARGYIPVRLRSMFVPVANIGSYASWILIAIGLLFTGSSSQAWLTAGIVCFAATVVFHIITLPVEFNASSRAVKVLENDGILYGDEIKGARKVLSAAALTYVASAATAILQLLRLIILFGGRDRD
ncbi:MAG: zinc metallopeptidase [Lachnospiraceae bacterium]|nr:zinc metallopeptidase [Lachnospiraceae bacterium]